MLASKRPFEGASYSEVVDRIQNVEPTAVASFNPLVEEQFEQIVRRMLAKPLNARYAHASEIVMDLEEAMDQQGLRRDRRGLTEFFKDPTGYADAMQTAMLARLTNESPRGPEKNRNLGIRHYRKILYLNPGDEAALAALEKLGDQAPSAGEQQRPLRPDHSRRTPTPAPAADPNADYRVVLEAINREIETPDTFALKLSIRLKSPVPRMRQLVARTPCTIAQRLPYKKARWLQKVIEDLGGTAHLEVVIETAPVVEEKPTAVTSKELAKPTERRSASGGIVCPRCGWEEEPDARFCSLCLHHFNKTDKIDVPDFIHRPGFEDPGENPLSENEPKGLPAPKATLSADPKLKFYIAGGVIVVVALLVFLLAR